MPPWMSLDAVGVCGPVFVVPAAPIHPRTRRVPDAALNGSVPRLASPDLWTTHTSLRREREPSRHRSFG